MPGGVFRAAKKKNIAAAAGSGKGGAHGYLHYWKHEDPFYDPETDPHNHLDKKKGDSAHASPASASKAYDASPTSGIQNITYEDGGTYRGEVRQ